MIIGGRRWSKVLGCQKFKINYSWAFYFTIFGTFSAIGEHEVTICLELSRALWKPQVKTWLLFNRHHWLQFTCVTNSARKWRGSAPPLSNLGGAWAPPCLPCSAAYDDRPAQAGERPQRSSLMTVTQQVRHLNDDRLLVWANYYVCIMF